MSISGKTTNALQEMLNTTDDEVVLEEIYDELERRERAEETRDYDEQDRRAYEEERIQMWRDEY